jgi:hypothetical protein
MTFLHIFIKSDNFFPTAYKGREYKAKGKKGDIRRYHANFGNFFYVFYMNSETIIIEKGITDNTAANLTRQTNWSFFYETAFTIHSAPQNDYDQGKRSSKWATSAHKQASASCRRQGLTCCNSWYVPTCGRSDTGQPPEV